MHDAQESGPPPSEDAMRALSPEVVAALAGGLDAEIEGRDFQPLLDRVGAQIAELLSTIEALPPEVARLMSHDVQDADVDGLDAAVMARIELAATRPPVLPPAVVAALADEASPMPAGLIEAILARVEALDSQPLSADLHAILAAEAGEPERPLATSVMAIVEALDALALPEDVVRALAEEAAPGAEPSLHQAVMAKVERAIEEELASDAPALAFVGRELASEAERMETARVVAEVQAEVRTIGPRLERELPQVVQSRITPKRGYAPTSARAKRASIWMSGPVRGAAATILAVAAAAVLYLRPHTRETPSGLAPLARSTGEVHVDEILYDGTVTVIESDGIAVIWLADEGTS